MKLPLDRFVKTDGNRAAYERIANITQKHDKPERIFLVGPEGSGKTALVRARQLDKDLLSTKRVLYRPCAELAEALRANVYDGFFNDLGEHEVLFLDDFAGFFEDMEVGPRMCNLLLFERNRLGLDTVITSRKPLSEYDLEGFGDVLDGFEEVTIEPLDDEGKIEFVRSLQEEYFDEEKSPVLSEEAVVYVATKLDDRPEMLRRAVYYLMTQYNGEPGAELSCDFVKEVLEDDSEEESEKAE